MKYSHATNYALHTMLYFVALPPGHTVGVQQLAARQNLSPTNLSKILAKLVKTGLIESSPGVNGGYRLRKHRDEVSFLEVIEAIEGTASWFACEAGLAHSGCLIQRVMADAQHQMEVHLRERKLIELVGQLRDADVAALVG